MILLNASIQFLETYAGQKSADTFHSSLEDRIRNICNSLQLQAAPGRISDYLDESDEMSGRRVFGYSYRLQGRFHNWQGRHYACNILESYCSLLRYTYPEYRFECVFD